MTDPLIGAVAKAAGAVADSGPQSASGILTRALGQAADEVGATLGRYTPRQLDNIAAVTVAASAKFGRSPEGQTSMRAAMRVAEEAAFAENEAMTEYLSGILASARSPDGSDDRAVGWLALVARLSSDQLRMHFLLYATLRQHLLGRHEDTTDTICAESCFVSYVALYKAMEWPRGEGPRFLDALYGLNSEDLVGAQWAYGPAESLESRFKLTFPGRRRCVPSEPRRAWVVALGNGLRCAACHRRPGPRARDATSGPPCIPRYPADQAPLRTSSCGLFLMAGRP